MGVSCSVVDVVAKHSLKFRLAKGWASADNLGRKAKSAHLCGWAVAICAVDRCDKMWRDVTASITDWSQFKGSK